MDRRTFLATGSVLLATEITTAQLMPLSEFAKLMSPFGDWDKQINSMEHPIALLFFWVPYGKKQDVLRTIRFYKMLNKVAACWKIPGKLLEIDNSLPKDPVGSRRYTLSFNHLMIEVQK